MTIISGEALSMKVKLAHINGVDNSFICRKCNHSICWCCGDVCDFYDHDKDELCPCINEGCEVEIK